ncbi:hypothetical protein ASNO1_36010 [Corallococcus caeni]|uniref:Uncharacterized protein n=1 Tax=Corallococcus caeni TaxID=3082388 RepID=A0ABQ6QVL9_9BACT|nr:hypothetical protein ASNO1_36010 [Corallococcus sp. NO1]
MRSLPQERHAGDVGIRQHLDRGLAILIRDCLQLGLSLPRATDGQEARLGVACALEGHDRPEYRLAGGGRHSHRHGLGKGLPDHAFLQVGHHHLLDVGDLRHILDGEACSQQGVPRLQACDLLLKGPSLSQLPCPGEAAFHSRFE